MILSARQYSVSRAAVARLKAALTAVETRTSGPRWMRDAEISALKGQIQEIETELSEYTLLTSGRITFARSYTLADLPQILIKARIASGMSQTALATRLNMKPQQIQRYESTEYMAASLARLIQISRELSVKTSGVFETTSHSGGAVFSLRNIDDIVWSQVPYREMIKRDWFTVSQHDNPIEKVRDYLTRAVRPALAAAYHRKKTRSGRVPNEYSLLAWQARIIERARALRNDSEGPDFSLDDSWIPNLVQLTQYQDGPKRACALLAKHGIPVVVERQLSGSYLDGAAMLYDSERPVIGMTLRYDRLDNFWFVLLHELGHIYLHILHGQTYDFFDEDVDTRFGPDCDALESAADTYALDSLISPAQWNQCISRFALSAESVRTDAKSLGVGPSIIAGRIRRERQDYTLFSDLVGQGAVRSQLDELPYGAT